MILGITWLVAAFLVFGTLVLAPLGLALALVGAAPYVVLLGYSVDVARSVMAGRTEPPAFTDWGGYARDGLSVAAIGLVYALPGLAVGGLAAVGLGAFGYLLGFGRTPGLFLVLVGLPLGGAYALLLSYVYPAALVNYARTGELDAGWDVAALRTVLTDREYAVAWVFGAGALFAANSVGSSLTWVLVGFAVFFYGQLAATYLFARGAMGALGEGVAVPAEPAVDVGDETPATAAPASGATNATDGTTSAAGRDGGAGVDVGCDDAAADVASDGDVGDAVEPEIDDDDAGARTSAPDDVADGDAHRALEDVTGVGPTTAEALRAAGYESATDLRTASRGNLTAVDGIGPAKADRIKGDVDGA